MPGRRTAAHAWQIQPGRACALVHLQRGGAGAAGGGRSCSAWQVTRAAAASRSTSISRSCPCSACTGTPSPRESASVSESVKASMARAAGGGAGTAAAAAAAAGGATRMRVISTPVSVDGGAARRISVRATRSPLPPAANIAAGSPPRCTAVSVRAGGAGATAGVAFGGGTGSALIGGPATHISYGPNTKRSPWRKWCSPATRAAAPLTKVPFVDRSRSAGPSGVPTISQCRAEMARPRSAMTQALPGSRPMG